MSENTEFQMPVPDPALKRLDFLVGRWELSGQIEEGPAGPAGQISGVETFQWLEGGFFLVHWWEGSFAIAGQVTPDVGYEFYDYDPATGSYRTHFFNNLGPYDAQGSKYVGDFDGDSLIVTGPARILRKPNPDGSITYDCDLPTPDGDWVPWMHAKLTKIG